MYVLALLVTKKFLCVKLNYRTRLSRLFIRYEVVFLYYQQLIVSFFLVCAEQAGLFLPQRAPSLLSLISTFPSGHPFSSSGLWFSCGETGGSDPKERVIPLGKTCLILATLLGLVLLIFNLLDRKLIGWQTSSASFRQEECDYSASFGRKN